MYAAGTKAPFKHPIGTGPFSFVSWQPGQSATYKRFDGYWGGPANLNSLQIVSLADPATRGNALMSGQIDLAIGIDPTQVAAVKSNPEPRHAGLAKHVSTHRCICGLRRHPSRTSASARRSAF